MSLKVQVISFLFSFFYGIFFEILLSVSEKILYSSKLIVKIIGSLLFVLFTTLLYFVILIKINNGVLHVYFFLCILLGYTIMCKVRKKILKVKRRV